MRSDKEIQIPEYNWSLSSDAFDQLTDVESMLRWDVLYLAEILARRQSVIATEHVEIEDVHIIDAGTKIRAAVSALMDATAIRREET